MRFNTQKIHKIHLNSSVCVSPTILPVNDEIKYFVKINEIKFEIIRLSANIHFYSRYIRYSHSHA